MASDSRHDIYTEVARRSRSVLEAGMSVVADGAYCEDHARADIAKGAESSCFLSVWLEADPARRVERIANRHNDASDATAAVALAQPNPRDLGPAWQRMDANGSATKTVALVSSLIEATFGDA